MLQTASSGTDLRKFRVSEDCPTEKWLESFQFCLTTRSMMMAVGSTGRSRRARALRQGSLIFSTSYREPAQQCTRFSRFRQLFRVLLSDLRLFQRYSSFQGYQLPGTGTALACNTHLRHALATRTCYRDLQHAHNKHRAQSTEHRAQQTAEQQQQQAAQTAAQAKSENLCAVRVMCYVCASNRYLWPHQTPPELIQGPGVLPNRGGKQVVKREEREGGW